MDFKHKRVIVTGGSQSIGLALALAFAEAEASVFITGRRAEKLEAAAARHPNLVPVVCDVTSDEQVVALKQTVDAAGGADILVNNAGIMVFFDVLTGFPLEEQQHEIEVVDVGAESIPDPEEATDAAGGVDQGHERPHGILGLHGRRDLERKLAASCAREVGSSRVSRPERPEVHGEIGRSGATGRAERVATQDSLGGALGSTRTIVAWCGCRRGVLFARVCKVVGADVVGHLVARGRARQQIEGEQGRRGVGRQRGHEHEAQQLHQPEIAS